MEYHNFVSAATSYSIAGMRSAQPVAKIGTGAHQGGFVFEAVVHWTYVAGSCMIIGMTDDPSKAYGNWSGTDKGIAVGWNASEVGTSTLKVMTGNGTDTTRYNATAGQLQDDATYFIRIEVVAANSDEVGSVRNAIVSVTNLDTGAKIVDKMQVTDDKLPPVNVPLYAMIQYGNLAGTTAVSVDMLGWSCERYRGF